MISFVTKSKESALTLLEKYGDEEIKRKTHDLRQAVSSLQLFAGGAVDGKIWSDGLPSDADKNTILELFDATLKDINLNNEVADNLAAAEKVDSDKFAAKLGTLASSAIGRPIHCAGIGRLPGES